MISGYKRIDET